MSVSAFEHVWTTLEAWPATNVGVNSCENEFKMPGPTLCGHVRVKGDDTLANAIGHLLEPSENTEELCEWHKYITKSALNGLLIKIAD